MYSPITKQNKIMKAINGNTIKYFYLHRFIYAAGIYWVSVCSTAKGCKGNGRSGPCRSGACNLIRDTRHIYMKQLENNPQVLEKREDGKGWAHFFFFFSPEGEGLCSYMIGEDQERKFQVRSSESVCILCSLEL